MTPLALIPILCWVLLLLLAYSRITAQGPFTKLRLALIIATIVHGILIVILTEGLSLFSMINLPYLLSGWLLILIALGAMCRRRGIGLNEAKNIINILRDASRLGWMMWVIGAFILVSLFLALVFPPNNYDSMTYHMARVAYWIQNKHVYNYSTHVLRQLVYQPFAEWVILHFQVLTQSDFLANSVQLFYYASCISAISLITKAFGGTTKQQVASSFFAALIPMAVIQSNTTQNDLVVSFFIIAFAYFTILLIKKATLPLVLLSGAALGLALLTKGNAFIFTFPFCCWYPIACILAYKKSLKQALAKAFLFTLIPITALLINSGFYYRNLLLNGSVLGNSNKDTGNQAYSIKHLAVGAFKTFLNHMPVNGKMRAILTDQAQSIGVDIDDPRYNFVPLSYMYGNIFYHEDYMQNLIHVFLIGWAILLFLIYPVRKRKNQPVSNYSLFVYSLLASTLLFCILLKWQPWSNRLQTPIFMLFCTMLAMEFGNSSKRLQLATYVPVFLFALGALFKSDNHPFPFTKKIYEKPLAESLIPNVAKECKIYLDKKPYTKIGLYIGPDSWDYPYHRYLSHSNGITRTIKPVFVNNESSKYNDNSTPDVILSIETARDKYILNGVAFYRTIIFKDAVALFEPK